MARREITQLDWDTYVTKRHAFVFVILWGMGIRKLPAKRCLFSYVGICFIA